MRQASDDALGDTVGYLIAQVASRLQHHLGRALGDLGLNLSQHACLALLEKLGRMSGADLARGALVTRQSMNETLLRLEERGLVSRPDPARRGTPRLASITPRGRAVLLESTEVVRRTEARLLVGLPDPQRLLADLEACSAALDDPRPV